jgi:Ca2+-binding EF-hand superfamily protein
MKRVVTAAAVLAMAATVLWGQEAGNGPAGAGGQRGGPGTPADHFKQMDTNTNGVLDKTEFRGPLQMFEQIDADKSGTLTREELQTFRRKQVENRGNPEEFFKRMDTNTNGVLDKTEFRGPPEMFDRIDADKSGTLTKEELQTFRRRQMENVGNPEERFKQLDTNTNGVIDKAEFRGPPEFFDRLDTDKSGTITKEELQAARTQRMERREPGPQGGQPPAPPAEVKAK